MTTYTWHIPGSGSGAATTLPAEAQSDQIARLFGRDIWFDVSASHVNTIVTAAGDWATVEGYEALRQSLIRRLITNPGEWRTLPEFGVGARQYVKQRDTRSTRDELAERIRAQFMRDDRVEAVAQIVMESLGNGEPGLRVAIRVVPRGRLRPEDTILIEQEVT